VSEEGGAMPPSPGGRAEEMAEREAEVAASEAGGIGGPLPADEVSENPAERPLRESGQGEAEGFEVAEEELRDIASHGDQHRFPGRHAPAPEAADGAEHGEPDQVGDPEER
jgi:hypothetical protein